MTQHFRHKMLFMTNFVLNMTFFCSEPAVLALRSRLLPHSIRMLCLETFDLGSNIHSQGTRRDEIGEVGRLTNKPMRPESSQKQQTSKSNTTYLLQLL
jgi:hypothetical protein